LGLLRWIWLIFVFFFYFLVGSGDAATASLAPPGHGAPGESSILVLLLLLCGSCCCCSYAVDPQRLKIEMKLIDTPQQPQFIYPQDRAKRRQTDPIAIRMLELCPLSARMWTKDAVGNNENPLGKFIVEKAMLKRSENARVSLWWWVWVWYRGVVIPLAIGI